MPTVRDLTDPYLATFTTVLPMGEGICDVCHGAPKPPYSRCYSCNLTTGQVSNPVDLVVPISLCEARGQLHYVLRQYKDGPARLQEKFRPRVAAALARFLNEHQGCIAEAAGGG